MGSTGQELLKVLPGAIETAGGAATGNPMLAAQGASQMVGGLTSSSAPAGGPTTAPGGLGGWGNLAAQVGVPTLGTLGTIMANRPQPTPVAPASLPPMAQPQPLINPVGAGQVSSPLQNLAAYRQFLGLG